MLVLLALEVKTFLSTFGYENRHTPDRGIEKRGEGEGYFRSCSVALMWVILRQAQNDGGSGRGFFTVRLIFRSCTY